MRREDTGAYGIFPPSKQAGVRTPAFLFRSHRSIHHGLLRSTYNCQLCTPRGKLRKVQACPLSPLLRDGRPLPRDGRCLHLCCNLGIAVSRDLRGHPLQWSPRMEHAGLEPWRSSVHPNNTSRV